MAKKIMGICSVCEENKKLSFEHYPPQAALNKEPVMIKDHRHLIPTGQHLYGKSMRSNRGNGGYKLCVSCNNNTGGWYAKDYAQLVNQNINTIQSQKANSFVEFESTLNPLNFLKQVLILHLCADQALGALRGILNSKELILDKEDNRIPDEVSIYMYSTLSTTHRVLGLGTMFSNELDEISSFSEFSFHPFGFLLALKSKPPKVSMMDITPFKNYKYNEPATIKFKLPMLEIKTLRWAHYP